MYITIHNKLKLSDIPKKLYRVDGRLLQYLGRALRPAPGKDRVEVYDYADIRVGVLQAISMSRQKVYEK